MLAVLACSVPLTLRQGQSIENRGFDLLSVAAGLAMAGAYVALPSLLMTTRAAGALGAAFAPMGRTALTSYVVGGPLMLASTPASRVYLRRPGPCRLP